MRKTLKGDDLRRWRAKHRWTQKQAAENLEMPLDTYKGLEKDYRPIKGIVRVAMRGLDAIMA